MTPPSLLTAYFPFYRPVRGRALRSVRAVFFRGLLA